MKSLSLLFGYVFHLAIAYRLSLAVFVALSVGIYFLQPHAPNIAGSYIARNSGGPAPSGVGANSEYAILHLEQSGNSLSGSLQIVPSDKMWQPIFTIKEGVINREGFLHLQLEEESAKNVQVSASVLGLGVSAPLANPTASLSSVTPVEDLAKRIEVDMQIELGGALGAFSSMMRSGGAGPGSRGVVTFHRQ